MVSHNKRENNGKLASTLPKVRVKRSILKNILMFCGYLFDLIIQYYVDTVQVSVGILVLKVLSDTRENILYDSLLYKI